MNGRIHNVEFRVSKLERFAVLKPDPLEIQHRLSEVEHVLQLLMRERGLQRVRVTEEIYQDLKTVITETREELRKVAKPSK